MTKAEGKSWEEIMGDHSIMWEKSLTGQDQGWEVCSDERVRQNTGRMVQSCKKSKKSCKKNMGDRSIMWEKSLTG